MKHKTHTLSQNEKNKHHKKKVLLLAILIPLGFLASGGAVVGGMAIAKVGPFKPRAQTPITLSNALYGDDTHTDVVLGVTYSQTEANALTEQTLMGALYTWLTTPGNHGDTGYNWYSNQLTIDTIGKNEGSQIAILHAKTSSVNYSNVGGPGISSMTLQYDVVSKKQLTEDLVTIIMPAAQQSDWNSQPDAETFLAKVKTWASNSNLNINQVNVTMSNTTWDPDSRSYPTPDDSDLGAYKITVSVKPGSDVYIDNGVNSTVDISYRLARADLSATGWLVNDIGKIFVVPQNNDEAAELLCDANSKTIANVEAGGGTFVVTTAGQTQGKVLVTINGSSIFSGKNFTRNYTVDAQVSLTSSTYFATTSGYFFNTDSLVTKFNEVPTRIDVINWFNWYTGWHLRSTNSITLVWPDISAAIDDDGAGHGTITLSGITGSYIYTNATVVLSYNYGA